MQRLDASCSIRDLNSVAECKLLEDELQCGNDCAAAIRCEIKTANETINFLHILFLSMYLMKTLQKNIGIEQSCLHNYK